MDCKYCFYYTWEKALLCAVDPITAEHSDASNCRHFQHDPQYIVNGFVTMDSPELGFMVAIPLPYKWEDHYEGGLVKALVVTRDAYGFLKAVYLPDNNVYSDTFEDFEQLSDIHLVDPECLTSIELEALASRSMED